MALCMFLCGLSLVQEWYTTVFISLNLFILFFQTSQGGVTWLYAAECTVDSANGLCVSALYLNATLLSLTMEYMIFGPMGPHGTFWLFAGINFVGFIWIWIVLKETRGLTNLQKRALYAPVNKTLTEIEMNTSNT